jgi:hypothetical protein
LNLTEKIDTSQGAVKKTGQAFLIAGVVIAAILFWKNGVEGIAWRWFLGFGAILFGASYLAYPVMKPIHVGWMKLAQVLAWVSTRVVLSLFFFLVLTPVGFVFRLVGRDLLDQRIDKSAPSYWRKRESIVFDPKRMENQF